MEKELNTVLALFEEEISANSVWQDDPSESGQKPLDAQSRRELLENLAPLLEMGSPECREFIGKLRMVLESEELIRQIENWDFDKAAVSLAGLKKKLEAV